MLNISQKRFKILSEFEQNLIENIHIYMQNIVQKLFTLSI